MDRIFIFKFSEKLKSDIYESYSFNKALEIFVSYFICKSFIQNGYFEILNKAVYVNNRKIDIIQNEEDILRIFDYNNVNMFYFDILRDELNDFIYSMDNILSHHLIKHSNLNIYVNCFATSSCCIISLES